jgi:hypothetical protein
VVVIAGKEKHVKGTAGIPRKHIYSSMSYPPYQKPDAVKDLIPNIFKLAHATILMPYSRSSTMCIYS